MLLVIGSSHADRLLSLFKQYCVYVHVHIEHSDHIGIEEIN